MKTNPWLQEGEEEIELSRNSPPRQSRIQVETPLTPPESKVIVNCLRFLGSPEIQQQFSPEELDDLEDATAENNSRLIMFYRAHHQNPSNFIRAAKRFLQKKQS